MMKRKFLHPTLFLVCSFLLTQGASAADWLTVKVGAPNYNYPASFIRSTFGGSGLGVTVFSGYATTKDAEGQAAKCCQERCYCGSTKQMIEMELSGTMYIAKEQANYSAGGVTGNVTAKSQADAKAHEERHVRINEEIAAKMNPYVASSYPTITTSPYSQTKTASDKALELTRIFSSNCTLEYGSSRNKYNVKLDQIEASDVVAGEWTHPASPSLAADIFTPISQLKPAAKIPTDPGKGDCQ